MDGTDNGFSEDTTRGNKATRSADVAEDKTNLGANVIEISSCSRWQCG